MTFAGVVMSHKAKDEGYAGDDYAEGGVTLFAELSIWDQFSR